MNTTTEITETVQDGVLKAFEVGQRLTVEALSAAVSTVDGVLPARPATPQWDGVPSPQELLDSSVRFSTRLLDAQKSFLAEVASVLGTPAARTTAKKAAA
jgi:hypothetical protein